MSLIEGETVCASSLLVYYLFISHSKKNFKTCMDGNFNTKAQQTNFPPKCKSFAALACNSHLVAQCLPTLVIFLSAKCDKGVVYNLYLGDEWKADLIKKKAKRSQLMLLLTSMGQAPYTGSYIYHNANFITSLMFNIFPSKHQHFLNAFNPFILSFYLTNSIEVNKCHLQWNVIIFSIWPAFLSL